MVLNSLVRNLCLVFTQRAVRGHDEEKPTSAQRLRRIFCRICGVALATQLERQILLGALCDDVTLTIVLSGDFRVWHDEAVLGLSVLWAWGALGPEKFSLLAVRHRP